MWVASELSASTYLYHPILGLQVYGEKKKKKQVYEVFMLAILLIEPSP